MLRLLALFLSLLSPVAYQEITAEVKETVRDERGGYLMVEEEDRFFLKKDDSSWRVELPKAEEWLAVLKEGNYLYLHASDAGWQAEEYNPQGKPVHSGTLIAEPLTLNCALYSEGLILVGGISAYRGEPFISGRGDRNGEDAIVLRFGADYQLEDFRIFGGYRDESFYRIIPGEDCFFAVGRKDPESGGDFGNGGKTADALFVAKLTADLELSDYLILGCDGDPLAFAFYKDFLYLALPDRLYKFDGELNIVLKRKFSKDYHAALMAAFNKCVFFGDGEILLVDILDFQTEPITSGCLSSDSEISIFSHSAYVGKLKYDLACLEDFLVFPEYRPEIPAKRSVWTLFGEAEYLEDAAEPSFDPQVHGEYLFEFRFKSPSDILFSVSRRISVPLRCNVSPGGIYPVGYRLQFSGYGELDGRGVLNNHVLDKEGSHRLVLWDNAHQATEIEFTVAAAQIFFSENPEVSWDCEAQAGEPFFLEIGLSGVGKRVLKAVVVNGEEVTNLLYNPETGILTVPLETDGVGVKHFHLEKLLYLEDGLLLNVPLSRLVNVNALSPSPSVAISQVSGLEYEAEVSSGEALRLLEVVASRGGEEFRKVFPLGTGNLNFELPSGTYDFEINLLYDPGNKKLETLPLFTGVLKRNGGLKIGEVNIIRKTGSLEKFRIALSAEVALLSAQGKTLYSRSKAQPWRHVLLGCLAGAASFGGTILLVKRKKRKRIASA